MATYVDAEDAIIEALKTKWAADAPAFNGGIVAPSLVFEFLEPDLKVHPRDSGKAWARVAVRHADANKASLRNSEGLARYRRVGFVWVQIFVPATGGKAWTVAAQLAGVAQKAYEGKRTAGGLVVFTKAQILDVARDGAWVRKDVRANFYWDEIH